MKILFVMSDLFYGGAEYQMRNIIDACRQEKHEVFIALENLNRSADLNENKSYLEDRRVSPDHIFDLHIANRPLIIALVLYYIKIAWFFIKNPVDVVFVYDKYGILAVPLFLLFRKKIVYSERNSGETTISHRLYLLMLNRCHLITCNSTFAREILSKHLSRPVYKINNLVEFDGAIQECSLEKENINVLVSARISKMKNQMYVLESLLEDEWKCPVHIMFAGKVDDEKYYMQIKEYVDQYAHGKNTVEFLGYVSDKEALYSKCDLVILPSYSEGTPNVILECFARKIPVIASNIPQNADVVSEKELLFELDQPDSLKKTFANIIAKGDAELKALLARNHEYVLQSFGRKSGPLQYVKLIDNMLKGERV